jgi:NAD(P)H-hydrate repair Nnr-like enzyme with NAD(P)H-hydrate dehydratase domain
VALKGAGTLICEQEKGLRINLNGNPGMATAGSGDVLAGMIGSLLAQGFSRYDAASAGVYMHGRAGDYAALRRCQASLMASDIIEEIPFTLRDITIR